MDTLAFENGRNPEIIPSWKFEINSNIISCSVTLGARASALRYLEGIYEEESPLIDDHGKLHIQDHVGQVVRHTLEFLRHKIEDELEELRKEMEDECRSIFSEQRISLDRENVTSLSGNKRKMLTEAGTEGIMILGVPDSETNDGLLHPPHKRHFGHRRSSSGSPSDNLLNLSSGTGSMTSIVNGARHSISHPNDHSRTIVTLATTVKPSSVFECPYRKHSSLHKDHSHRTSCRGTFDGASKLRQHVRIAYRAYFCPVENCFARFPSTDERKGHIEPCKEKGPKADRDISSEDREAFKNAKIMMEKNVPLQQIQEIIDQLCKDAKCTCHGDSSAASDTSSSRGYAENASRGSNSPEHPGLQVEDNDQNYTTRNSTGAGVQFSYEDTTELHNQPEGMMVDSTNHQFTTGTSMGWDDNNYHPRSSIWGQAGLKNGMPVGPLPPIMIRIHGEDVGGVDYNDGVGYQWT